MDFEPSPTGTALAGSLQRFIDDLVLPSYAEWHRYADVGVYPLDVLEPLKQQARALGLWNLFLPGLRDDQPGTRLASLDYAPLCEIMGRVPWSAEVFNCSAPDSGNIELLQLFATPMQRDRWLDPLLAGAIRSCFAMSEPDVASSDATNIETRIERDGADWVVNGRKWFITGAAHPLCRVALEVFGAMGLTPDTPLARLWRWGRAMRFFDGPDEVHLRTIARSELSKAKRRRGANEIYLRRWMPVEP